MSNKHKKRKNNNNANSKDSDRISNSDAPDSVPWWNEVGVSDSEEGQGRECPDATRAPADSTRSLNDTRNSQFSSAGNQSSDTKKRPGAPSGSNCSISIKRGNERNQWERPKGRRESANQSPKYSRD